MFSVSWVVDEVIKQQDATRGYVLVQEFQSLNSACRITALPVMMIMHATLQQESGCAPPAPVMSMHAITHSCHHSVSTIVLANSLMVCLLVCIDASTFYDALRSACDVTIAYLDTSHSLYEGR